MKAFRSMCLLAVAAIFALPAAAQSAVARPETVGMSADRLKSVDAFVARMLAEGKLAGAVTLVARRGQLVKSKAHGYADLEAKRPMRVDDIFQIQSMTQPIATVAALMLLEEGRFLLNDPVAKFLPEFSDMKVAVARSDAPDGHVLVPAERAFTIYDLLTHRAGFIGLPPTGSPAEALRRKALTSLPPAAELTLEAYIKHLAESPLDIQPGSAFRYGPSTVVLGRLIEVVAGRPLDEVLRERIFVPLRMNDTAFSVPAGQRHRVPAAYDWSADKGLAKLPPDPLTTRYFSAGGNLFSTPADYLRFCQMLLNGGELDGQRLLSRKSVELMTARHVDVFPLFFLPGQYYGLGVAVRGTDGRSGLIGSAGAYGWAGGCNTYFRIDPQERLILLFFTQRVFSPTDLELQFGFHNTVMQAIID
jgi:CubicO group peptidase (beta-lactamase class C family)